ncbi:hypothetical protein VP01_4188g1 [Puccinia sorghi]|uniref:Uncharacterized protein n=1 Tax=Puccinia sorghi TaxID=27349 RepID=A0A0L6UQU8_9BASI|nr:hypothetical protein VP01_4188g1 [Puccinia sorghi]
MEGNPTSYSCKGLYPGKTHPPPEPVNVQEHLDWESDKDQTS